jgi:ubiquitin-protein ligase
MSPINKDRLLNEQKDLVELQNRSSLFRFQCDGVLSTSYKVILSCKGLFLEADRVFISNLHKFDIILDDQFPYLAPTIIWRTPIFHPNFKPPYVCLGDHWYPAWSLAEMCSVLIEMVQYRVFNIYDPLDPVAALWLEKALHDKPEQFPVDKRPIYDLDFVMSTPHSKEEKKDDHDRH